MQQNESQTVYLLLMQVGQKKFMDSFHHWYGEKATRNKSRCVGSFDSVAVTVPQVLQK